MYDVTMVWRSAGWGLGNYTSAPSGVSSKQDQSIVAAIAYAREHGLASTQLVKIARYADMILIALALCVEDNFCKTVSHSGPTHIGEKGNEL